MVILLLNKIEFEFPLYELNLTKFIVRNSITWR